METTLYGHYGSVCTLQNQVQSFWSIALNKWRKINFRILYKEPDMYNMQPEVHKAVFYGLYSLNYNHNHDDFSHSISNWGFNIKIAKSPNEIETSWDHKPCRIFTFIFFIYIDEVASCRWNWMGSRKSILKLGNLTCFLWFDSLRLLNQY